MNLVYILFLLHHWLVLDLFQLEYLWFRRLIHYHGLNLLLLEWLGCCWRVVFFVITILLYWRLFFRLCVHFLRVCIFGGGNGVVEEPRRTLWMALLALFAVEENILDLASFRRNGKQVLLILFIHI